MPAAYDLPTSLVVGGREYPIRSDFRAALDVMEVLGDPELSDDERAVLTLEVMFEDASSIPTADLQEAIERAVWFVRGGEERDRPAHGGRVMDWSQDFRLLVAPVNRVLGCEVRSVAYLHWWSFLAAYYEVGDCLFAQVVAIRKKLREGKKLDKSEQKFYRENREVVELRRRETGAESALFDEWTGRQ